MKLIYKCLSLNSYSFTSSLTNYFEDLPEGGRFYCNLSRAFLVEAYIPRSGIWSDPFEYKVLDSLMIPKIDKSFTKNFEEVTDNRVIDIKNAIDNTNKDIVVYYSGGIDSTVMMCALIKNLQKKYLDKIIVAMSSDSIIENPYFYQNFISDKFRIVDSNKHMYSDFLLDNSKICVTADLGDFIYGTELGIKFYQQIVNLSNSLSSSADKNYYLNLYSKIHDPETHYSNYKDLLIDYFNNCLRNGIQKIESIKYLPSNIGYFNNKDKLFGELFYEKIHNNIRSVDQDINSLHDFFWWSMFNMRFIWGAVRPLVSYASFENIEESFNNGLINWYGSTDYQLWSMNNNNNGEKMNGLTSGTYKWASRKYIYSIDQNDYYFNNKIKMPSGPILIARNYKSNLNAFDANWAVDENYDLVNIKKPGLDEYMKTRLFNYTIDWIN